jgi:hypothetical protein
VILGLLAPPIAWICTRNWDRKNQLALWEHEFERVKRQAEQEDSRESAKRERDCVIALQTSMQDAYTRFLAGASGLALAAQRQFEDERSKAIEEAQPDFVLSFQQLLLVTSNQAAKAAVSLWNGVLKKSNGGLSPGEDKELDNEIRAARRQFVIEARLDIESPEERNSNPGITLTPSLTVGGFQLEDAG